MATFGTTTQGAGTTQLVRHAWSNWYQVDSVIQPTSISAYVRCNVTGQKIRAGIYKYISDTEAGALLVQTALTDVATGTDGLITLSVLGTTKLAKGKYHLVINGIGDAVPDDFVLYVASSAIEDKGEYCWWGDILVMDPFGGDREPRYPLSDIISAYCTYTTIACASFTTRVDCEAAGCYWYDGACHADPYYSHDEYSSGYLTRFQKRQIVGFYQGSGDLRSISVCASGEVMICSGVHVISDVEVEVSSGIHVVISGQHVHLESGDTIDVYVQSGSLTDTRMQGYDWDADAWRNIAVCTSGELQICSGVYVHTVNTVETVTTIDILGQFVSGRSIVQNWGNDDGTWKPMAVCNSGELQICSGLHVIVESGAQVLADMEVPTTILIGTLTSGAITNPQYIHSVSGGDPLQSGACISVVVKALSTNSGDIYAGGYTIAECPMSGYGLLLNPGEAVNIDIDNIGKVHCFAENEGDKVTYLANKD